MILTSPDGIENSVGAYIKSFKASMIQDIIQKGYLGQVADQFDDIYKGYEGEVEFDAPGKESLDVLTKIKNRAQRRGIGAQEEFSLSLLIEWPDGRATNMIFQNMFFESPDLADIGGREEYMGQKFSFKGSEYKIVPAG